MPLTDILARFDALAWGVLVGSALLLGGFLWVLLEDRPIQERLRPQGKPADGPVEGPREGPVDKSAQQPAPGSPGRTRRKPSRVA